jgi:hypothetical protein
LVIEAPVLHSKAEMSKHGRNGGMSLRLSGNKLFSILENKVAHSRTEVVIDGAEYFLEPFGWASVLSDKFEVRVSQLKLASNWFFEGGRGPEEIWVDAAGIEVSPVKNDTRDANRDHMSITALFEVGDQQEGEPESATDEYSLNNLIVSLDEFATYFADKSIYITKLNGESQETPKRIEIDSEWIRKFEEYLKDKTHYWNIFTSIARESSELLEGTRQSNTSKGVR